MGTGKSPFFLNKMDIKKLPKTEFAAAVAQIAGERNIDTQAILDSIEAGLISAYKRDQKEKGVDIDDEVEFEVNLSPDTGSFIVYQFDADGTKKDVTPPGFGRIAAQTAKQVIDQKIYLAEKETLIAIFMDKVGTLVNGNVIKIDPQKIAIGIGKAEGILPKEEQVKSERFNLGDRNLFLVKSIVEDDETGKRDIILTRSDPEFIGQLLQREVPEIASGSVVIEKIARSAGIRTKVAVSSSQPGVDPVGSCIGQKGSRIQSVLNEVPNNEKIDIVLYSDDIKRFLIEALSPAQDVQIIDMDEDTANITVPEDQLALAIGTGGENVRLAGQLVEKDINISAAKEKETKKEKKTKKPKKKSEKTKKSKKSKKDSH